MLLIRHRTRITDLEPSFYFCGPFQWRFFHSNSVEISFCFYSIPGNRITTKFCTIVLPYSGRVVINWMRAKRHSNCDGKVVRECPIVWMYTADPWPWRCHPWIYNHTKCTISLWWIKYCWRNRGEKLVYRTSTVRIRCIFLIIMKCVQVYIQCFWKLDDPLYLSWLLWNILSCIYSNLKL